MTKLTAKTINYKLKLFNNMRKFIFLILVSVVCFGFLLWEAPLVVGGVTGTKVDTEIYKAGTAATTSEASVNETIVIYVNVTKISGQEIKDDKIYIDFGDGSTASSRGCTSSDTECSSNWFHSYSSEGTYTVKGEVWEVPGGVISDTKIITITAEPLPPCSKKGEHHCKEVTEVCDCNGVTAYPSQYCCAVDPGQKVYTGAAACQGVCTCTGCGYQCCPEDKRYCSTGGITGFYQDICDGRDCCDDTANCTSTPPSSFEYPPGIIAIENPLTATSFERIIDGILDFIFKIGIVLAPLMIIIGGLLFVTAAGNLEQVERAKKLIIWTGIGFIIILLSKGLLAIIEQLLGVKS